MFGSRNRETVHVLLKHGTLIVQELQAQFREGRNCDLEIRLGKKRLYVHKCLVDIFFLKAGAELEDDRFFLDLSRYSQTVVEALVGMMYTGKLKCEPSQVENVCLAATDLGCVEGLQGCKSYAKDPKFTAIGQGFSYRRTSSEKSPEPFQVTFPQVEEADPNIIVKTEPIEDIPASSGLSEPEETNNLAYPAVPDLSSFNWPDKHSTLCVPVTGPDAGRPVDFSRPSRVSTYTTKQAFSTHVVYSTVHPALNNRGKYSYNTSATSIVNKSIEQQDSKKNSNKTKKGKSRKNVNKKSSAFDKSKSILNLVRGKKKTLKGKKRKSGNQPTATEKKSNPDLRQLENRSGMATGTETLSEQQNELQDDEDNNEGIIKTQPISNLVKCRTKSGVVYYKEVNPNNLSKDEFSANFDHADVGNVDARSKVSSGTDSEDTVTNKMEKNVTVAVPEMTKQQDKWAESCNKDADVETIATEGISGATNTESDDEKSQRQQMFHLGLERKSDKVSNIPSKSSETSNKRRLRERKKVDYSKFEDDNGNDSCEIEEIVPVKKAKKSPGRSSLHGGERYVEISQETKNYVKAKLSKQQAVLVKTEESSSENEMNHSVDYMCQQKESSPKFPPTALTRRAQGTTVAVLQSEDSDDEECAYFPPAATVPKGVRSQYARGNLLKLKTVTEQIYDKDGNVTVVTKKIPLRPRQYGLDERLMNRPSVYICHPTAPVIKPVVKRKQYKRTAILTDLNER